MNTTHQTVIDMITKNTKINIVFRNDVTKNNTINEIIDNVSSSDSRGGDERSVKNGGNDIENTIYLFINNIDVFDKVLSGYDIGFAESYMDHDWDTNNMYGLLCELLSNGDKIKNYLKSLSYKLKFRLLMGHILSLWNNNDITNAKNNVVHHYDIGNDLYTKMLGKHMQYTCAYFNEPGIDLDEAQARKMIMIGKKLDLKKGMRVLDIGCGFGKLAYFLAKEYEVEVTGVTLSEEQIRYYNDMEKDPEIASRVNIKLLDYRMIDEDNKFDRVYSIGMFEHVGRNNYKEYYDKCFRLLKDDGLMMIHTIGFDNRDWNNNCFVNKYIFPGAEMPHINHMTREYTDNWRLEDWHNFGISYSKTLCGWWDNVRDWAGLDRYDDKFRRMWEFYLLGCAAGFKSRNLYLWQVIYSKKNTNMLLARPDDCHHIRN